MEHLYDYRNGWAELLRLGCLTAPPRRPCAADRPVARLGLFHDCHLAPPARPAACRVLTTVHGALKLYTGDPSAPPLTWQGDPELADALAGVKAILS